MPTKMEILQRTFHQYEVEHGHAPARMRDAVAWGHAQGMIDIPDVDPFDILANEMARALRQEYAVDDHGRRYRVNHAVHITKGGI